MLLAYLHFFVDLRAGQEKLSNRKYGRSKTLMSCHVFRGDVLNICLWNLVYLICDPGQHDLSKC